MQWIVNVISVYLVLIYFVQNESEIFYISLSSETCLYFTDVYFGNGSFTYRTPMLDDF